MDNSKNPPLSTKKQLVVGVVGCGWLGRSVAIEVARWGIQVKVFDSKFDENNVDVIRFQMVSLCANLVYRQLLDSVDKVMNSISYYTNVDDLYDCDIILECIHEDVFAKRQILCLLDRVVPSSSIIMSACLSAHPDLLSKYTTHPGRVITCLWLFPVYFIPFVAIAVGTHITPASTAMVVTFFQTIYKEIRYIPAEPKERTKTQITLTYDQALSFQAEYAITRNSVLKRVFGVTHFQRVHNFVSPESENSNYDKLVSVAKSTEDMTLPITCVDITQDSASFKTFTFEAEVGHLHAVPGQVCKIQWDVRGQPMQRFYALLNPTDRSFSIGVQLNIGFVSQWLDTEMKVGTQASLVQTFGNPFLINKDVSVMSTVSRERFLFIAGGSGITPLYSMMKWLGPLGANVILLYSVKGKEVPYLSELADMMAQFSSIMVWVYATKEMPEVPYPFVNPGRITQSQIHQQVPDIVTRSFYVLGPLPFMQSMKDMVHTLAQNHYQHFLEMAKTGPDNDKPADAHMCWQPAFSVK